MFDQYGRNDRQLFVPEVVQTSAMDCGPATLKSLLEGYNINVSYGRLREACQTDVDGTSIDTMEEVAIQLGLEAEQVMVPIDHLLLSQADTLPAIVVVRQPSGLTHFVVVWNQIGPLVQVMDPAAGRRWVTKSRFLQDIYQHEHPVPAEGWRDWAGTEGFCDPLRERLLYLDISEDSIDQLLEVALSDENWYILATLDAATRITTSLVNADGVEPGEEAATILTHFFNKTLAESPGDYKTIPASYWSVQFLSPDPDAPDDPPVVLMRGAVLVRAMGLLQPADDSAPSDVPPLSPELVAALEEEQIRPDREVLRLLKEDGFLAPSVLTAALALSAIGVLIEALLFRGLLDIGYSLDLFGQRAGAVAAFFLFIIGLFLLELPINSIILRIGRRLETRLRIAFLEKIPKLSDRYFHSRLTSDMTQRAYDLRQIRQLPTLGIKMLRLTFQIFFTALGVIWLDPISAPLAIVAMSVAIGMSFVVYPTLVERDLRLRTHIGALSRFYLDALLGLIPIRTHGAERAVRREHEGLLVEWARAGFDFYRFDIFSQGIEASLGWIFAVLILFSYINRGGDPGGVLLLFYWTLNLPALGVELSNLSNQYPLLRNRILRLLEPLGAPEEADIKPVLVDSSDVSVDSGDVSVDSSDDASASGDDALASADDASASDESSLVAVTADESEPADTEQPLIIDMPVVEDEPELEMPDLSQPLAIRMEHVTVQAGGHTILSDLNLSIGAGEHVGIVGPSGAGKSSLVGILLGWHRPTKGRVLVSGKLLHGETLQAIRRHTAWVDPAVQIWNRSLLENLQYGALNSNLPINEAIEHANLFGVLERLPDGMQTILGEGGGLVSGGEGQRVRLGRAIVRPEVRLVILDEPFRGLDRPQRRQLLTEAREYWKNATLLCITHDVGDTDEFERVLVIEEGCLTEDATPAELLKQPTSRYRQLWDAEKSIREELWTSAEWRRLWLADGHIEEHKPRSGTHK
ncbi:cysteine peptidase family C39 domain-containing protein [Anaerolineales bacterium HSG24]|nr:cysteine peptidase family C39 domain-containing protein [Anaerolineales bacterium HSG24]